MVGITDVHYRDRTATAALVLARDWRDAAAHGERTAVIDHAADYEPGAFFRRELPALLAVLDGVDDLDAILVDGYVWLAPERPGLGVYLWRALGERVPVIGVAKSAFVGAAAIEIRRARSARPLYVTSTGIDPAVAAARIATMHGPHRIPTLIKRADQLARGFFLPDACPGAVR